MNYNTSRPKMIIPEYGRHIQSLIDHAVKLEDKDKRNEMALAIIDVMGQLNPHLRDVQDFKHKLWDHIFIMSDFKLEVDSPYPVPTPEHFTEKPNKMSYPQNNTRFKHYGKGVENLVKAAIAMEEGEEKDELINSIANLMKKHYITWGRSSVNDDQIISDLIKIAKGKLKVPTSIELIPTKEIATRNTTTTTAQKTNKKKNRKSKSRKKY
ncbi:MAG: DUF4290 domain-containing protein [Bacteroidetes bacterium]|nr:MAG: DUF4290 domain-containing protein [Bacteroidota bacterium]MBL1145993.1 DUF4290 domain-containing protein [Bacteroidota bacterium]MCB0803346.1 DUF4290 domain-containing protein [Flavobacteriales bacterium]NOG58787.1 DUF4290 domain-containing protein [Bacteroidota bacterium]